MSFSPAERAKTEAEVLQLIYGDDIIYCKLYDVWKRFNRLQVCIHLGTEKLSVDLEVSCPPNYPESPPTLTLSKPNGFTKDMVTELTKMLNKKVEKMAGSECIYDLCTEVQTYIKSKDVPEKSMFEKMVSRQESSSSVNEQSSRSESAKRSHNRNSFTEYESETKGPSEIKQEEEIKCRREQLLKQLGTLGNTIKVELLSKPGQLIDIAKIMEFEVTRKAFNNFTYEYFGFDQNRVLLVSEYRFDSPVNRRNKEALVSFEKTIKSFVESAKLRTFPTDNFLSQFAFFHSKREKRNKFAVDLLIGQYIDVDSKCLGDSKVLTELKNKKKSLPKIANHLLCGLKTLHEQRSLHGNLGLESVWFNTDENFFISDHCLMPEILHLYDQFAQINTINEKQRQPSVNSIRLKDLQTLGGLLKTLSSNLNVIADREAFDDFIQQCSQPDVDAQKLLNHGFLYQGFNSMSSMSSDSLLSSANLISTENAGRLVTEYNVLGFLGSGGFGSVFLARNKLDGNDYAIKRISLSGMSKKQIEKIKNEVAVFSRLSNEHITRYFSSWVETIELKENTNKDKTVHCRSSDLSLMNELPAQLRNISDESKFEGSENEETSPEEETTSSSSGPGFFRGGPKRQKAPSVLPNIMSQGGSDLSIMFLGEADDDQLEDVSEADEESSTVEKPKTASFLCLQMEFCQNKTLRSLIDCHQLYLNSAMIWRLFKEILLGLEFMHSYNLIHRDIKPGNIFLDSNWSVKIGDFGLATRLASIQPKEVADRDSNKDKSFQAYSMTKDIGTHFYMPPEAKHTNASKFYGDKFDIFSVGIVLFEMIFKPPESRCERVSCLERLRNEFVMPDDFLKYLPEAQRQCANSIVKWCLHENPEERPSASELLQSELLPVTISEEDALHKNFVQIAQDPKHRFRRLLFNELFAPVLPSSIGILYDKNYCIEQHKRRRQFMFNSTIIEFLSTFFRSQGFNYVPIASLIPSAENYSTNNDLLGYFGSLSKPYKVIDENGVIIQLSTNLRQNLARYISHSNIQHLRSFSIDRIHSQSTSTSAFSSHPDARTEFCLDIVRPQRTTTNSVAIEILQLVIELSQKLRPLSSTRWQIILNHTDLIKAVGIHYSISEHQRLCSFFNLLYDFSSRLKKTEYSSLAFEFSRNFNMSDKHANELIQLVDTPTRSIHKLRENLRPIINNKNIRSLIEHSIGEMDFLFQSLCHNLDASLELTFLPSFVYQPLVFNSGLLFSLRVEILDKGKKFWVPIVGGGDYNSFLQKTRQLNEPNSSINVCAFGFNLSVENVAHLLKNTSGNVAERFGLPSTVLINCTSIGYLRAAQELANQLREQAFMSVELSNEEIAINDMLFEYCRDKFINFIVTLVGSNELVIYVNSFDKSTGNNGFRQLHNRISLTECLKFISSSTTRKEQIDGEAQKSIETERFESSNVPTNATLSNVNLIFCISRSFKVGHHTKKKYESVAYSVLQNLAKRFNKSIKIDAYITELPPEILTQISNLDRSAGHDRLFVEFETIANSQARYKSEVKLLYDEMETFLQQQPTTSNQVVFLFCPRHSETFYRIIM